MKTGNLLASVIGGVGLLIATGASAGHGHDRGHDRQRDPHVRYDYAQVIDATPIVRYIETSHPEQQCWDEQVQHHAGGSSQPNIGGMILGGVVGGVVGNRFGGGNGKKAMTAAGAILGAAVGNELGQNRHPGGTYTTVEQHCETVRTRHTEERIVGYNVRYRYNGQEFTTRTDRDPGRRLRVNVAVTPVH